MKKYILKTLITFIVFSVCFSVKAQTTDSLTFYLEIAARNNPIVLQKYNDYQAALRKVTQVGSLPDPELSIGVFLSPMEIVNGKQVADIRLMQMFPWFGVLKNAKDEMSLMAKANFESLRQAKLQVFYDVQSTWYELIKVRKDIAITEKNVDLLKTIERLAIVRYSVSSISNNNSSSTSKRMSNGTTQDATYNNSSMGSMSGGSTDLLNSTGSQQQAAMQNSSMGEQSGGSSLSDLYRIQIEVGDLNNSIALLKNQQNTIVARFNSYLNRPILSKVGTPQIVMIDSIPLPMESISDSILVNNPMLSMINYEKQSINARQRMVTKMGYPMVGLGLNYSLINKNPMSTSSMNGKDMLMPMVTVTLPIYRKKYDAMQSETKYQQLANEQSYSSTANALQVEYTEAIQLIQDANRRVKLYDSQSQLAQKTLDLMIRSFSTSNANLSDILRTRQQLLDYETKKVEAISDYNTSIAWIKKLMASTYQ